MVIKIYVIFLCCKVSFFFFFFNDTATTEIYTLSLHDALPITAIDILLEPDATMLQHAVATNERLRKAFRKGFALDASHRPHITLVQRFVLTENLDKVYAAVGKVFASANVTGLKLEAFKYYYIPDKDLGLSGIVIKPTPELLKLEHASPLN